MRSDKMGDKKERDTQYMRQWRIKHPEHTKQWNVGHRINIKKAKLKHRYNLSLEDWKEMWKNQDGRCAICGKSFIEPSDAHVDHNHETNQARGLLCGSCNRGIGMFHDNIEELMNAVRYLNKTKE